MDQKFHVKLATKCIDRINPPEPPKNINNIVHFKEVVKLFQTNKKSINKELLINKKRNITLNKLIKK